MAKSKIKQTTINNIADIISNQQNCGSCANTTPETRHCPQCENDAKEVIQAIQHILYLGETL